MIRVGVRLASRTFSENRLLSWEKTFMLLRRDSSLMNACVGDDECFSKSFNTVVTNSRLVIEAHLLYEQFQRANVPTILLDYGQPCVSLIEFPQCDPLPLFEFY